MVGVQGEDLPGNVDWTPFRPSGSASVPRAAAMTCSMPRSGQFTVFSGVGGTVLLDKALAAVIFEGDVHSQARCIERLGRIALARSDHAQARRRYEDALPLFKQVRNVLGEANCIQLLGDIALERSDHVEARQRFEGALPLYHQVKLPWPWRRRR